MADVNFIEFSTEAYFIERPSIFIEHYKLRGIHLLPNNSLPYIQVTNVKGGIELEDWTCLVVTQCGNETDITNYFKVESIFTDYNGDNQFVWSIKNVPYDFGYDLVHLKVIQTIGETFYSNWFMFTDYESEQTCRIDYKNYNSDYMQSIQLPIAFKQEFSPIEIETYYETSTKRTVINTVKEQHYESWLTQTISNDLLLKIIKVFTYKFTYVNLLRCNLFEAIEQKEYEAAENFAQNTIKITFDKSDIYDPILEDIPVVEPLFPTINLSNVVLNGATATYYFDYANFNPKSFVFEYSIDDEFNDFEDQSFSLTRNIISPQSLPFNETGVWYFRITHPQAVSNVIELNIGSSVIANDDTVVANVGSNVFIDVLNNDDILPNTVITNITTPNSGTATIIDNGTRILYTPIGNVASDTFNYTISNGLTSDTATVTVLYNYEEFSAGKSVSHGVTSLADQDYREITGTLEIVGGARTYVVTVQNEFNTANTATGTLTISGIGTAEAVTVTQGVVSSRRLVVPVGTYTYTLRVTVGLNGYTSGAATAKIETIRF